MLQKNLVNIKNTSSNFNLMTIVVRAEQTIRIALDVPVTQVLTQLIVLIHATL